MGNGTHRTYSVFVIDDHEVVRDGVRGILEAAGGFDVVGEAGTIDTALEGVLATEPDVAIVDSLLPGGSGIDLIRSIRSRRPQVRCLVLTSYPGRDALHQAVLSGASGYITKDMASATLVDGVRKVCEGGTVLEWSQPGGEDFVEDPEPDVTDVVANLTPQERRILDLIAEGRTNREIAERMFLAEKTVRNYVSNVLAKLGAKNRTQAATLLVQISARTALQESQQFTA